MNSDPRDTQIAALHQLISDFDSVTDPEEYPDLHERAYQLLAQGSDGACDNAICRQIRDLRVENDKLREYVSDDVLDRLFAHEQDGHRA